MVPPKHLGYIASISKTERFDISLTTGNIGGLGFVRAILSSMLRLKRVFQRMAVLKDGLSYRCGKKRREDWRSEDMCRDRHTQVCPSTAVVDTSCWPGVAVKA